MGRNDRGKRLAQNSRDERPGLGGVGSTASCNRKAKFALFLLAVALDVVRLLLAVGVDADVAVYVEVAAAIVDVACLCLATATTAAKFFGLQEILFRL